MTQPQGERSAPRKTLGLTGITINAMALMAPGALMWLVYPAQAAAGGPVWPGVLLALLVSLLTAASLGELARRYPKAGLRSAYHFAESAFQERAQRGPANWLRAGKFVVGWAAHLYYWLYPGLMIAFTGILGDTILGQWGYHATVFGKLILVCGAAALVGFLALRGITGSTTSSVVLNVLQLAALLFFAALAFFFRGLNPLGLGADEWTNPSALAVLLPAGMGALVFQAALALVLTVGFEASTNLGANATHPERDVPRAAILALVVQGTLAYLLEYFAAGLALNRRVTATASALPVSDLSRQAGDALLGGNGSAVMLAIALTVFLALLAAALTALNNGVRISFSMSLDREMPGVLSLLHPRYATPYVTVLLLGTVSAVVGAAGLLGGLPVLMGLILAANLGAFGLYAALAVLAMQAYAGRPERNFVRHLLLPVLGLVANLGIALAFPLIGIRQGGVTATACWLALGIAGTWLCASALVVWARRRGG